MQHDVTEIRLANGIRGLLINVPDAPVMTFDFCFRAGYYTSTDKTKWETPHVLEHVLLGANKKHPKARLFNAELEKNGAYSNGTTSQNSVHYIAECADFEWDRILGLMTTALTEPLLKPSEFKAELGNVHEELVGYATNYFRVLGSKLSQEMGLDIVTDEERVGLLDNIKLRDVKEHYLKTHTSKNLRFIIGGKIRGRKQAIVDHLRRDLGKLQSGERFDYPQEKIATLDRALYIDKPDVEKLHFYLDTYDGHRISDEEYDDLNILNAMLTGTLHSLMFGEAREKGLVYGMWSGGQRGPDYTSWWFGGNVTEAKAEKLFGLMRDKLQHLLKGHVKTQDVDAAKKFVLGRFQRSNQRVGDVVNGYSGSYFYDETVDEYDKIPDYIMSVNKKRIIAIARKLVDEKIWGFGLLGRSSQDKADRYREILSDIWQ